MEPNFDPGALEAVNAGVVAADTKDLADEEAKRKLTEENEVKALWKEYDTAREFDKEARAQYAVDRRYAAGTANLNWAVTANLIGAFIDILVSFLYARNPDVSVRKAPRVNPIGTKQEDDFAKTMELVISSLWKAPSARLKTSCRSQVRSVLTNGVGWLKVLLVSNGTNIPQLKNELNDIRNNLRDLEALRAKLAAQEPTGLDALLPPEIEDDAAESEFGDDADLMAPPAAPAPAPAPAPLVGLEDSPYAQMTPEQIDAENNRLKELEASVSTRLEVAIRKGLAVDFVAAEDMQVSLDVRDICDYVNAGWNANAIYRQRDTLCSLFPGLTEADVQQAKCYYQRKSRDLQPLADQVLLSGMAGSDMNADEAEQYVQGTADNGEQGPAFAKIVELWDKRTGHVKTMVEGMKRWAKPAYQPDYPTSRFFPYFQIAFYPVDGARHPQSLSWRLAKLQDEYAACRSSLRLTRERATPGTVFNSTQLDPTEAAKLASSKHQELIGLKPTNPDQPLRDLFAEKPISVGDMRLFDTMPIVSDMERISGVQEALSQSSAEPKTATEAEIQQSGFASRTTADRDVLETMLTDLAHYTGELSLSALDDKDAQRIAGAHAFWPAGMAIDDLLTMVEVTIEAGTTGKPKSSGDRDAWGVVMPMIKESMLQIQEALMMGNKPLADALIALLQETMSRMGDESDVTRFIPTPPELPVPGVLPPGADPAATGSAPGDPGAGGVPPTGEDPNAVPGVAPAVSTPPELMAPELAPPV
jgi:hypothetical protein